MRRTLLIADLLITVFFIARPADAAFSTGCCACLEERVAQTSQAAPPPTTDALACNLITGRGYPDFVQLCDSLGGNSAPCFEPTPGVSCTTTLADAGIACPKSPGAPTATAWGLGALALVLTVLGLRSARRRAR